MHFLLSLCLRLWVPRRSFTSVTTTESAVWKPGAVVSLSNKAKGTVVDTLADSLEFGRWGTCFNERGYDAISMLPDSAQASVMRRVFAPDGELRINMKPHTYECQRLCPRLVQLRRGGR